ncbi:MAG: hypothetical protein ACOYLB_04260 [Phototrophicaceae bacterium]
MTQAIKQISHPIVLIGLSVMLIGLGACRPTPETIVYVVLSPTPETTVSATEETPFVAQALRLPTHTPTPISTETLTPTPTPTELPPLYPTSTGINIQVAEQVFELGRMYWVEPNRQIWVLTVDSEGAGRWFVYSDTFVEGEPETDPSLVPPKGLIQPERGFGKLWRENPEVRQALGWALSPEFGYISRYEYHPKGKVVDGAFVADFGYHILFSFNSEAFRFDEKTSTWRLN